MVFSIQILGRKRTASRHHGLAVIILAVLPALSGLAGCGQKGPLFIAVSPQVAPAPSVAATVPAAPALPASASK